MGPLARVACSPLLTGGILCIVGALTASPRAQIVAPSAGGKVLYEDSLTEGWTPSTGASCRSTLGDGGLIVATFAKTTSYCAWGLWGAGTFDNDVRIELTARLRQGPP